jgi:hypothetical protein
VVEAVRIGLGRLTRRYILDAAFGIGNNGSRRVSYGGTNDLGQQWTRDQEILPIRVLRRMFRGKFLAFLGAAFRKRKLHLSGALGRLKAPTAFDRFLRQLRTMKWVVYARRPFGGPVTAAQTARFWKAGVSSAEHGTRAESGSRCSDAISRSCRPDGAS